MEFSDDENEIISQENFEKAEQEKKEYFEEGTMIGWMLCRPGARMVIDTKIFNTHEKYFSENIETLLSFCYFFFTDQKCTCLFLICFITKR